MKSFPASERVCHCPPIEQVIPLQCAPLPSPAMNAATGHHDVDVGMIVEPPGMGMQDRTQAQFRLKTLFVQAEGFKGRHRALNQQIIDRPGMGLGQ